MNEYDKYFCDGYIDFFMLGNEKSKLDKNNAVNHPNHYNNGDIEVIDYIKDKLGIEGYEAFCIGNVIKYVSRYKHKNGKEDLEKALTYLKWAIEVSK